MNYTQRKKGLEVPVDNEPLERRFIRPEGWMENPFIGRDGRSYHSHEALKEANKGYRERHFRKNRKPFHDRLKKLNF
ncbi:MAG: hypothetical protein HYS32_04450 [Candidatus Woesearchaeota archaeon]|nr:MAG: hypothetical protein HYS32_04450 [Candidatus Woesearchaeota archaeon]